MFDRLLPSELSRAALLSLLAWLACACGGSQVATTTVLPGVMRVGNGPLVGVVGSAQLAAPNEPVQLAMFIDAGSRDANAPEVATLAAWLLAESVGHNARGRAFPDGIEVLTSCPDGLQACLRRLARGLASRAPSAAALARAARTLAREQRESIARDPERRAEQLAVRALRTDAEGFFPLGNVVLANAAEHASAVREFMRHAFGPERALVVGSGPIDANQLAELTHAAFARAPRAESKRSERDEPELSDDVRVEVDASSALSIALGAPSVALASTAAEALRSALLRDRNVVRVTGSALSVRGGALALLRVALRDPRQDSALVRRVGHWIEVVRREGVPRAIDSAVMPSKPLEAMRWLGASFAANGTANRANHDPAELRVGIGVLVRGGRADRLAAANPDAALRKNTHERLRAALREGAQLAQPELTGELDETHADIKLANGARIAVRSTLVEGVEPAPEMGVALSIAFAGGATTDAPTQHGRAALLATLMATACAGRTPDALSAELAAIGARLEPHVSAYGFGITLQAPTRSARAAIALAVECALSPSLDRGHVTLARLRLRERLGSIAAVATDPASGIAAPPHALAGRAEVARALSMHTAIGVDALGALAPWGSADTLPSIDERALMELIDSALRGPSTSVGIAGAVNAELAAVWSARRLAALSKEPAQPLKLRAAPAPPPNTLATKRDRKGALRNKPVPLASHPVPVPALPPQAVEALAIWQLAIAPSRDSAQPDHLAQIDAARAFAAGAALSLEASGLQVAWLGGDCTTDLAWAAVVVRAAPTELSKLSVTLASAMNALRIGDLARAAEHAFGERAGPSLSARAQALAERAATAATPSPSSAAPRPLQIAQLLIERFRTAAPLLLPTR